jgi:hypothetical protein
MRQIAFLGQQFNRELVGKDLTNMNEANFAEYLMRYGGPTLGL